MCKGLGVRGGNVRVSLAVEAVQLAIGDRTQLNNQFLNTQSSYQGGSGSGIVGARVFSFAEVAGQQQSERPRSKQGLQEWKSTNKGLKITIVVVVADEKQLNTF